MRKLLYFTFYISSALVASAVPKEEKPACGTCYVCKYNNDLACVNVRLKKDTPFVAYHGQNYFFCGTDCRDAFSKRPEKYLPKK